MFTALKRGWVTTACALFASAILGIATPALGADETYKTADLADAHLTKVINAPSTLAEVSGDSYTFSFDGTVEQDATVAAKDVPNIASVTVEGVGTLEGTNQVGIVVPLKYILGVPGTATPAHVIGTTARDEVVFPHAGIYTYRVTESSFSNAGTSTKERTNLNPSCAAYLLRITVSNDQTSGKPVIEYLTVERIKNDEGTDVEGKVDSTKPIVDPDGRVDPGQKEGPAGDARGRDVDGFTFANEYVNGDVLIVKKQVEGKYADLTKAFDVTLTVTDPASPSDECSITYIIEGADGKPVTDASRYTNAKATGAAQFKFRKNGPTDTNEDEWYVNFSGPNATIKAQLKTGESIIVTGLYGFIAEDSSGRRYVDRLTEGLKATTKYTVVETLEGTDATNYKGLGKTYSSKKPAVDDSNLVASNLPASNITGEVFNDGAYVLITNTFQDSKVTPTGIFIDNLPYVLMVGVPLAVFALMFMRRRREGLA